MEIEVRRRFLEFYEFTGCVPCVRDCDGIALPTYIEVKQNGGLRHILAQLNIKRDIKPELIKEIIRFFNENLEWPKVKDCQSIEYMHSHNTYAEHFDTWSNAIEIAKRELNERKIN